MNEQKWAERFCRDVDRIMQGKGEGPEPTGPLPEEYRKAVDLARVLAEADFSSECGAMQELRRRLLDMFAARVAGREEKNESAFAEFADEELENVAGGVEKGQNETCSLCNCRRSGSTITGDTCPNCGHPREFHPR
ncbi:MAG: hypothetical protein K6T66_14710 [Peptococcaceae bacterium]|nr:hypothetical protein [Peptococcaceae bacterium]